MRMFKGLDLGSRDSSVVLVSMAMLRMHWVGVEGLGLRIWEREHSLKLS